MFIQVWILDTFFIREQQFRKILYLCTLPINEWQNGNI